MKKILLLFSLFAFLNAYGQKRYYCAPVQIPMFLSGSFAELRSNHFHSGIDIKTNQLTGIPVHSVADGFVSRISVSPSGFGNALYIDHYNGTTSVYGHLESFRDDIQQYIKKIQYQQKSFRVDVAISPEDFLLEKGEVVAKSGNSGSSGGPHLHFEIRDTKSEEPLNPLKYGFDISDNIPPKIFSLLVVPLSDTSHVNYLQRKRSYPAVFANGQYRLANNIAIPVYGKIGFAIESNDYLNGSANRCGIYSLTMQIDGEPYFNLELDRFSFAESRYINSYIDYAEYTENRRRYQKTWKDPGNNFSGYKLLKGDGIFEATDNGNHLVEIELKDTYGNTSNLQFWMESKYFDIQAAMPDSTEYFKFNTDNKLNSNNMELEIPEGALYSPVPFEYGTQVAGNGYYSDLHKMHNNSVPLHKSASLKIKAENLPQHLQEKALLVNVDPETGKFWAAGGEFQDGWVKTHIRNLGTYAVRVDTIPPKIVPLSIANKSKITESSRIRFIVSDDLAGIKNIEGMLDGKWALFEYDAKNNLISHYFDAERFDLGKRHEFKLKISDYQNNTATYEASFWK